jgi:hypothetical protein
MHQSNAFVKVLHIKNLISLTAEILLTVVEVVVVGTVGKKRAKETFCISCFFGTNMYVMLLKHNIGITFFADIILYSLI